MKTTLPLTRNVATPTHLGCLRLRIAAGAMFFAAAAALAAIAVNPNPPKLPWRVPTVNVGINPVTSVVDQATHTIYVANAAEDTVSVIDGTRCNSSNSSRCSPIATLTVGPNPLFMAFDPTTGTLYAVITGNAGNTIAVVNANTCNARNTSGCGQTPASVTVPGTLVPTINPEGNVANLVLDTATHALYVGDADEGPVSFVNTAICNGTNTAGCSQTLVTAAAHGDSIGIDRSNHSVYATNLNDGTLSVFNGASCNPGNTSGCGQAAGPFPNYNNAGIPGAVDEITHTVYLPFGGSGIVNVEHVAMIDGSTCNGIVSSGCGNTPPMVQVGNNPTEIVIDPTTRTVYVGSQGSAKISVINADTCNATNQAGCSPTPLPALALGIEPFGMGIDVNTHTLYAPSQNENNVWVLDASKCNATHTSGCTHFAPTTSVGVNPVGIAANPNTHTVYEVNQFDNTVSVINTSVCNASNTSGCDQTWPTVPLGNEPRFIGINKTTNTIYVGNFGDGTLSVINGATCNSNNTSGCSQPQPTTSVGNLPQQIAVDEANNTIYVANQDDGTVSVIDGAHCNGTDTSGCNQSWPTVTVGNSPQALGLNPTNQTLYVTNTNDDTVSVISTSHCNGGDSSGCTPVATVPVGAAPRAVGIDAGTNTVFVGNRDDVTVSVIDGATCNGTNTWGCGQTPFAVPVAAFPNAAGNDLYIFGRGIAIDPASHKVFMPVVGDSDVVVIDGRACRGGNTNGCQAKVVPLRMGGFPVFLTVDESSGTVYVTDNDNKTVSIFSVDAPLGARSMRR
jgi:DNA-binding beta-propeller fold protein YncE